MGCVYAAEDVALRRLIALKTLKPDLARKEATRVRFMREARAAAAVEPGRNTLVILSSLAINVPMPPHELNPEIPLALSDLIVHLLAKRPEDHTPSAREVAEGLRRINKDDSAAAADLPVVYAPPATAGPATLWEDVPVPGATGNAPARPVRQSQPWPGCWSCSSGWRSGRGG